MDDKVYAARLDGLAQTWAEWARIGASLTDVDWERPTRCPGWNVRGLYAHHSAFPVALASPPPLPAGPRPSRLPPPTCSGGSTRPAAWQPRWPNR
jgi:Mycothiol maleylpyruvate isomerase N-terminal domain